MNEIDKLAAFSLGKGYDCNALDSLICTYSPQLNDLARFVTVNLSTLMHLIIMAKPKGTVYVEREDEKCFVAFAIYPYSDACPVARVYILRFLPEQLPSMCGSFQNEGLAVVPVKNELEFERLISAENASVRIREWKAAHTTPRDKAAEELAAGRHKYTFVEKTHYLRSETCLLCEKPVSRLMNSNIGSGGKATSLMFGLCEEHAGESLDKGFILEYLAKKVGADVPWEMKEIDPKTDENYFDETVQLIKNTLCCEQIKEDRINREVSGIRPSGFKVVLRIQSNRKRGYAYVILDPRGKNVERIDDAPDHLDLNFQFDHRHTGLPKENKSAVPSFTFGYSMADVNAILAIIEKAEAAYR